MAELVKAHSKALMPSFGDGKEDQRAIEGLTKEITDLLRKSEKRLQKLSSNGSSEDSNLRKNVQVINDNSIVLEQCWLFIASNLDNVNLV